MITISKSSLLYRFLLTYHSKWDIPNNLCKFVRMFLITLFLCTLGYGVATCFAFSWLVTLAALIFLDFEVWMARESSILMLISFLVLNVAGLFLAIHAGVRALAEWNYKRRKAKGLLGIEKKPSLVTEYYRAVKNKYCPQLEFKDA